tara:strand:- start:179 stop:1738 length:1560 start_codon:yes stop_codon:yes gene_type:complete
MPETTEIVSSVAHITGATTTDDIVKDAQKFVASSIPKTLMWAYASKTAGVSSAGNPITDSSSMIHTDNILGVDRNGFSAKQVGFEEKGFLTASSGSLLEPTKTYPKWIIAETNEVSVFPAPEEGEEGSVYHVNYTNIGDTSDLRNAVVYRVCSVEFAKKSRTNFVDWTDLSVPVPPSSPDFGDDLSITTITPIAPTLTANTIDTSSWGDAPSYTKPVLSFTAFPSLSWTFPPTPVAPSISITTNDALTGQPTFIPPAMNAPDFDDVNEHMTNEDPELVQARLGIINAQVAEYGAKMQEAQAQFNKESAIFQSVVADLTQEAQFREASEGRKLQKFQAEQASYQGEVQKVVSENQGQIGEWQQQNALSLQKFGSDIQNELNIFNKEQVSYQANIQKSMQDAKTVTGVEASKIQSYTTAVQVYQQEVTKEVQDYQVSLTKKTQEYQSELALFNASLQKFQNEVGEKTQEITLSNQQSQIYAQLSEKYYNWSVMEVTSYVQNNAKSVATAMARQQQQPSRRR